MSDKPEPQTGEDLVRYLAQLGEEAEALRQRIEHAAKVERRTGVVDRRRSSRSDRRRHRAADGAITSS